ncbi:MAG: mechanosensitive ion channel family protein [Alphaproteobacteria bacterium]|nr:mechanosensitive ion channel family protein [Alphaproteobacteria bacterium]
MRRAPPADPVDVFANMPLSFSGASAWLQSHWPEVLTALVWIVVALAAGAAIYLGLKLARDRLVTLLRNDKDRASVWRSVAASVVANTWRVSFFVLSASVAAAILGLSPAWWRAVIGATLVVQVGLWLGSFLREFVARYAERKTTDRSALANAMSLVQIFINVAVWSIVALVLLSNMGMDVTALVAGLGVGGIAIGLAAQSIFADLFASLSIILDRPFMRGDFVVFGEHMGTIERIGIKSTRIRSLSGEQIVVSNSNLLQATIRNYQLLYERRIQFKLNVSHRTPVDKLAQIPGIVRDAITSRSKTRFDRGHLKEFGDSALLFEFVYFVLDPDYNVYMDVHQEINLAILRAFETNDIDLAFPQPSVIVNPPQPAASNT